MVAIRERLKINKSRYWEVDSLRGVAIVLMVFYHLVWDLNFYGVFNLNMLTGPWSWFARFIATIFISVMGVSMVVSYNRAKANNASATLFPKYLLRGAKIFGWGLVITLATYFVLGRGFVVFGILHLIGFSIVAAYPFLPYRFRFVSLILGILFIVLGGYLDGQVSESSALIWLGIKQTNRFMVDYYPVMPWFGVALVAIFVGNSLYPKGSLRVPLADKSEWPPIRVLSFLGQHSLTIYLLHQPILFGTLILLGIGSF